MKKIYISRRSEQVHSTKDKRIRLAGTCRKVPLVLTMFRYRRSSVICLKFVRFNQGQLHVFFLLSRPQVSLPLGPALAFGGVAPLFQAAKVTVFTLTFAENKVALRVRSSLGMTDWQMNSVQFISYINGHFLSSYQNKLSQCQAYRRL